MRTVTFDRPDASNALTTESAAELADVLSQADPDELDAIVLTGEGRAFSAEDLESIAALEGTPAAAYERIDETFGRLEEALDYESPVQSQPLGTDEHREGVSAFLEDRDSAFQS
ncbi:enoyl-CoA hydratase/isomerase family protein [Halalkalicoccus ordinarius]|uniref:enoyl-CoA hydratase/isomerase family protein n=1 Tax=Halalkalicoccus ordinarius TaxID=3116651 RepID=UPI00300E99EB